MKEIIQTIAKSLVDFPDDVIVTERKEGNTIFLQLHVASSDMGKVIGKQGRVAHAMRTVLKSAAIKENCRVELEII
jgi:predicted RNA-binding protein YlqC (UPF0109 family)